MLRFLVLASFAALALAKLAPEPRYLEGVNPEERIVGGEEASADSWPWKVFLEANLGGTWHYICTGVLIKRGWVLTSAICVDPELAMRVVLGDHDIYNDEGREQHISVSRIYTHPDFNFGPSLYNNDIALLRLSSDATLNNYVQLAVLPPSGLVLPHKYPCFLTGWGHPESVYIAIPTPLQLYLPIVDNEICSSWWGIPVTNSLVCAGGSDIGCKNFLFGPLNCSIGSQWVIHGLANIMQKSNCDTGSTLYVFTRVSSYISWINSIIG